MDLTMYERMNERLDLIEETLSNISYKLGINSEPDENDDDDHESDLYD